MAEQGTGQTPAATEPAAKATVYFDGACPLCQREIAFYRKRQGADVVAWVDVSAQSTADTLADDLCRSDALKRFHVRKADGTLVSGAEAFITLWQTLPGFRWAGRLLSIPPLPWIAEWAYLGFLKARPMISGWLKPKTP